MASTLDILGADVSDAIRHELDRHATLFDTIERSPLTLEQRIAAVTMVDRHLLVAAAGSGKTSSMVGKVAYAIKSGQHRPEQILVLAFNRKAALELQERLGPELPVKVRTLHALGLDVVTCVRGQRPFVRADVDVLLRQVLRQLVHQDVDFSERWLLFRVFHNVPVRHPRQFASRKQWRAFVREHGDRRHRRHGFLTLCGKLVPTQFEQAVANWLLLNGLDICYGPLRSKWLRRVTMLSAGTRSAFRHPLTGRGGFYLKNIDSWVVCLDARDRPLQRMPSMIAVYLDEFKDTSVFTSLRQNLAPRVALSGLAGMNKMLGLLGHRLTSGQVDVLTRFVTLARLNDRGPNELVHASRAVTMSAQARWHLPMLARLLTAYQEALDQTDSIDFEGMLHRAADHIDDGCYQHDYTLIMVDEFQDTSRGGMRLLTSLLNQNRLCKLFAVGDDWQSIYRFAGAVPDVLNRFEHYFGPGTTHYLTATFRFDQTIANLASHFVERNPAQLRKRVLARAATCEPAIVLARYTSIAHMYRLCEACLQDIANRHHAGARVSVYILGRYKHQRPPALQQWRVDFPLLQIDYLTVHSAKGLEADKVIVLGLHTGRYGFPSQVPDNALLEAVMPDKEVFPHAEERRLFYVAITRSRHGVYLLSSLRAPSPFVQELVADQPANALACMSTCEQPQS